MRKKFFVAMITVTVMTLTGCVGKEGGIIENNTQVQMPTLGHASSYKETEASTQKATEKSTEKATEKATQKGTESASKSEADKLPNGYNKISGEDYYYGYPSTWVKKQQDGVESVIMNMNSTDPKVTENINVVREYIGTFYDLEKYKDAIYVQYSALETQGYKAQGSEKVKFSGKDGYVIFLDVTLNNTDMKINQYFTVANGYAYILTYTYSPNTNAANLKEAQTIIDSFTITK